MKNLLLLTCILFYALFSSCGLSAQETAEKQALQNPHLTRISSITLDSTWITTKQITHYDSHNSGATTGGLIGGTAGWILVGGPVGVIGGAILGAAVNSKPETVTWVETQIENHYIYTIKCVNGYSFKTNSTTYFIGELVDSSVPHK